jgi:ATPase subunit of ABC transporter with duplicated ATPase domains
MMATRESEAAKAVSPLPPRVSMRGIRKAFGSIEALRGVDLDLMPGECLGLVGDNAAGKSTLTKILSGAYVPTTRRRPKPAASASRWSIRTSPSATRSMSPETCFSAANC